MALEATSSHYRRQPWGTFRLEIWETISRNQGFLLTQVRIRAATHRSWRAARTWRPRARVVRPPPLMPCHRMAPVHQNRSLCLPTVCPYGTATPGARPVPRPPRPPQPTARAVRARRLPSREDQWVCRRPCRQRHPRCPRCPRRRRQWRQRPLLLRSPPVLLMFLRPPWTTHLCTCFIKVRPHPRRRDCSCPHRLPRAMRTWPRLFHLGLRRRPSYLLASTTNET
mmetsp:Transcript_18117/g.52927  ORF Transcript_18117/g.52927 Transcript_18117/m.52927 type:complete len:225 (-) Transcript_18117:1640-2314(-)